MAKKYKTKITERLGIEYPILCGGMQWVSRAEFVASVCNAGGIGFITALTFDTPEALRDEIKKMRTLTDKPFGVNVSMLPEFGDDVKTLQFCDVICEEGVKVVETAGASPVHLMPKFKAAGIKVIHKLTSVRHAESAQKLGVDAVTLLGYGSGGHVGTDNVASFIVIPLAVKRLDIPVIAGGAVADGAGFLGALAMGAEAVLMGTVFFAAEEANVHPAIKQKLIDTREVDTTLLMESIRNPLRCVKNKLADEVLALESQGADLEEIVGKLSGSTGKLAYNSGDTEISPIACGQVVGLVDEVKPVKKIIDDIVSEADGLLGRLGGMIF